MRGHKDAVVSTLLGFALTSVAMLPPIISERAEKFARIADYDAAIAESAVSFGQERQARLAHLLRNLDKRPEQAEGRQ